MLNITHHQGNTNQNHLTLLRVAKMNNSGDYRCWRECGEMETLLHCWWECKLVQPLWKTVWRLFKKLKIELPYNLAITLLGIFPNGRKKTDSKGIYIYIYIYIHTHTEYYSAIKKNEILPFAMTWMELESVMLSEISQLEKDKYHMISLICGI